MLMNVAAVATILTLGAQLVVFLRWLHRRMRDDEIARAFVRDLALVHLPHIYDVLGRMSEFNGVAVNPPPIQFVDFQNGRTRKVR